MLQGLQSPRPARPLPARSGPPRPARQAPAAGGAGEDIPEFDRNKVSLDFPGNLFGPSVSLLIKTTKIIGDVIQNSAVRYQSFLRLFQPLFRGPFEIKGLDPPPSTTTSTPAPRAADNEKGTTWRRPRRAADDTPVLDRNKVSLVLPGNLLGPTLSFLIDVTKVIGDVVQNSAVRFQSFLRLLRPLFRGPFEIKGLDPPPSTTRARAPAPAPAGARAEDNEVRR